MATENSSLAATAGNPYDLDERTLTGLRAAWEIDSVAGLLIREHQTDKLGDTQNLWMLGVAIRLRELSSVVLGAFDKNFDGLASLKERQSGVREAK